MDIQFDRPISNLDFEPNSKPSINSLPPLPHKAVTHSVTHLQGKSEVVDSLMNQVEDLTARLKINIRKLNTLEETNLRLVQENREIIDRTRAFEEQVLIIKEKDSIWKEKTQLFALEKDQAIEKMKIFEKRYLDQQQEILRLKKFHDKVKSQVRPYIGNLKALAQTLESRVTELTESQTDQKVTIENLRTQILEMSKNFQLQMDNQQRQYSEVVNHYESELTSFKKTQESYIESQRNVDGLTLQVEKLRERANLLENELVAMTRSKEEQRQKFEVEMSSLQAKAKESAGTEKLLTIQNQDLQAEIAQLKLANEQIKAENTRMTNESHSTQEQLEALRYMWNAKNEEYEKRSASYSALQKLNLELSQKIQSLRNETETLKIERT